MITYEEDKTQWISGTPDVTFQYKCTISKDSDKGLFPFVEKSLMKSRLLVILFR